MASCESPENVTTETKPQGGVKRKKTIETGVLYLSRIPRLMNVKKIRDIFSEYGIVGRIYLQPNEKASVNKKNRLFEEGWIEYNDKRIAKRVARSLNNQLIGGKRHCPWYEEIWNIKYLPKFKWGHLNERLAYEREVHKQRLRTEIAQAKKKTSFYIQNVEKRQIQKNLAKKGKELRTGNKEWSFKQRDTEEEILTRKRKHSESKGVPDTRRKKRKQQQINNDSKQPECNQKMSKNKSFLQSIFSGGLQASSDED